MLVFQCWIIVSFAVNSAVTPGLVYGSRLLVKLLATVAGIAILVIVLLLLLGMVVCGARSVWYAVFNKQDKVKEIKEGSQALLIKVLREPLVKGILTLSVFAAYYNRVGTGYGSQPYSIPTRT